MWIHLPSSVSTPAAADLTSDSSWPFQVLEQSVTWKETRRRSRSWWTTCRRASWMMRLCGQIPAPLTAGRGVEQWIGSLAGSRASHSQSQAPEKGPTTNAGSGPILSDWFARYDPEDCFWKTSQASFMEELNTFSEGWPRSGTMRNGLLYERPMLAHPTAGSGSSSWPTVRSHEVGDYQYAAGDHSKPIPTLSGATREWMTPKANEPGRTAITQGRPIEMATHLNTQASHWLTPKTPTGGGTEGGRWKLEDQAEYGPQAPRTPMPGPQSSENDQTSHLPWPTPRAGKLDKLESSRLAVTPIGKRLNPKFVEWLMGLPEDWLELTAFASSATE